MMRFFIGASFARWGLPGLLCMVLLMGALGWWLVTSVWWLIEGTVYVFGLGAGVGYLILFVSAVRWLRNRGRPGDHLLLYGRNRRWPD